jgi:hypothetical protein
LVQGALHRPAPRRQAACVESAVRLTRPFWGSHRNARPESAFGASANRASTSPTPTWSARKIPFGNAR